MIYALTALFALLQVGDWWTTKRILANGGREINPVMRALIGAVGVDVALIGKGVVMVGLFHAFAIRLHLAALAIACTVYVGVVWHNWRQG